MVGTIWDEINHNEAMLEAALGTLRKNGEASAAAEKDYRLAKARAIITLREKGYPTTLIPDLVKGLSDVAELDYKRNIADVVYKANLETINVLKKKSDDLRIIYEKEWMRKENQ